MKEVPLGMATKSGLQKRFDNFKNSEGSKNPFSRKNRHKKHPEDRPQDLAQEEQPPNLKPIPPLPELAPGDFGAATPPRSDPSVVLSRKELPPPNVNNQRVNTFPTERSNGQTDRQPALLQPIVDVQRGTADISSYLLTDQDLDEQVPPPCPKTDSHTYEIGREITPGNPDDYHFNIRDPTRRRTLESPSELQESPRPGLQERLWECERQLKEAREQIQAAEAKGSQLESLKVEIARQNQKLTHLEAMRESKKDIKRRYRQELDDSERLRRWELEVQRRGHQQRWQTYSKELESKHIERIRALEREHIGKEENAEKQITALRTQIEREKDEKRIEVQELMDEKQRLTAIYQQDLTNLQNEATRIEGEHAKNHEAWVTWHHDELAKNKGEYKAKLDLLKAGLAGKLKESKDKYDQEVEEHDREMKEYEAKMENMKDDHARKVQELDKTHSDRIKSLEQKLVARHKNQIRSLNEDVRELNATLLRRDDEVYTGMVFTTPDLPHSPDEEIRHQFGQIQQLVDELGRTEWKQDRTVWKDELIQGLDQKGGQRLLRKAILQDIIWTILFQAVFCSPFRMFGEEGIKLDQEWNEGCGRGTVPCLGFCRDSTDKA